MKQPATLVFDIGKTAKKVLVFDSHFHVVEERSEHFAEISDEDGFPSEDLSLVSRWVKEMMAHYLAHERYEISHVNFSAYGASLVHLDESDTPLPSFYNYLKPFPEDLKSEFLDHYNPGQTLLETTSSPWLGMLNSGLQLFWMKRKKKELFSKIRTSLHLPQYFSFLLGGSKISEITSIGCHTLLWDFQKENYHHWVDTENLSALFPPIKFSGHSQETTYLGKKFRLGIGVHDSSAALMPYLVTMHEPFLLLSTGTWNITFNPFNNTPLTSQELKKDCLCYLTFEGKPVKASRIFLGHEYEMQVREMLNVFKVSPDFHLRITFDEKIYNRLVKNFNQDKIVYPTGMEGTGPLPEKSSLKTNWRAFESIGEAYHQLIRYLVRWQLISINLINPDNAVKNIIVVGGFTKNLLFLETMKREAKYLKVFLSDHPRASALGAAWLVCGSDAYNDRQALLQVTEL